MKRNLAVLSLAAALMASGPAMAGERTVTLAVKNMYCSSCPYIVQRSLLRVPGVEKAAVSYAHKIATVTYNDTKTTLAALTAATTDAGYPSQLIAEAHTN
jgi:periplasmic mercuric ion binding protein